MKNKRPKEELDLIMGSIIGGAIGDALGEIAQKKDLTSDELIDYVVDFQTIEYTDDTAMAIGITESLINNGRIDVEFLGSRFHTNWIFEPTRGYSDVPPTIFFTVEKTDVTYLAASKSVNEAFFGATGSNEDGAAMRVHPIGLFFNNHRELIKNAVSSAKVTHTNQIAIDAAVVVALAVSICAKSTRIRKGKLLRTLARVCSTKEMKKGIRRIRHYLRSELTYAEVSIEYGNISRNSIRADSVVPFALYCFLKNDQDFLECLKMSSCSGGDADTIAAISSSISGSHLGISNIPSFLSSKIENSDYLKSLSEGLYSKKYGKLGSISYSEWRKGTALDQDTILQEL